ncbi:type I polyketide synthase [uncultured Streptomyces sp.]|uniref:type I polyketide synthase n=1 Tax=uncultured Streptomyces sp. TaxID=174707 RepID=UPI00261A6A06|nr:type I polyketide synthase [uncultured Streptomyces sp.]
MPDTTAGARNMSTEDKLRDYLKRVTTDLAAVRQRLRATESAEREPIAIVGMACRYPGGVDTPEALWRLVEDGVDAVSPFPTDRGWDMTPFDAGAAAGVEFTREGGFLENVADFDPSLFNISPNEALAMDPQQRLVLETSWEAVERAGIDPLSLRSTRTGVFTGVMYNEYASRALSVSDSVAGYLGTGSSGSIVSGRVSYTLGLEGPALTVDTACSSSLVALHLAVRSLRAGECSMALAGGVAVMITPNTFIDFGMSGGLAADGRCKSFSADAEGAGWAEGVGMLLVERLSDALAHGHPVLAVVRGSAVNQDGASSGLTAPNGPSQQRVIRDALDAARLTAADIDAVEAHGTGTKLGDPIEAQALLATYGQERPADRPLWLGSLKSNIGHAQAAAGVGGVIKMVGALRNGVLPRTLHADVPSPHVDWSAGAVRLLTDEQPWPAGQEPRRAGISSFGVSGTNAHVVIEEYRPAEPEPDAARAVVGPAAGTVVPWVVSARTAEALRGQAARLLDHLGEDTSPVDVGLSLVSSRASLEHRAVVLAADLEGFRDGLAALAEGRGTPAVVTRSGETGRGGAVFVFPGQGSQWAGMAAGLLDAEPVFAARMAECAEALAPFTDFALLDVVRGDGVELERVEVVQPVLWAVMVSLAELWRSVGVVPAAVVGHSQGEIAAAVVAGALSLVDGARVVALRSGLIARELAGRGGMASLAVPASEARELVLRWPGLSVAAVNGPGSTVVSGDADAIAALVAHCTDAGVRVRRVPVDYASHSAHVEGLREQLLADLAPIRPTAPVVPFYSSVTGGRIDAATVLDATYWYDNLRNPVRFEDATRALLDDGRTLFLETSPHPGLTVGLGETIEATGLKAAVLHTLRRDEGGRRRWLTALAEAHVHGVRVDWTTVFRDTGATPVDLPTYAFQRRRYWLDTVGPDPAPAADPAHDWFWDAVAQEDLPTLLKMLDVSGQTPLGEALGALTSWHRRDRERAGAENRRYRLSWIPAEPSPAARLSGRWAVAVHADPDPDPARHPLVAATLAALREAGAEPELLTLTASDTRTGVAARLRGAAGILSLLALAEDPTDAHPSVPAGFAATLTLLHAVHDAGGDARVWCATAGAVAAAPGDTVTHPAGALVWGFGRSAAHEYTRWGGLVDLPTDPRPRAMARLAAVLGGTGEQQVAVRAHGTFVPRLHRGEAVPPRRTWSPTGTSLITGGTGALGGHLARWLAAEGAEHLLLISRRGPAAPGAAELVAELEASGSRVTLVAADPADPDVLAGILAGIPAGLPLTAVFHTAGVVDSSIIDGLTLDRVETALRSKARIAYNLHRATAGLDLSAFVLFSSLAAVFGSAGEGNYGPGNAYLDALAHHRRAQGLPATSVAWGSWAGGGMADGAFGDALERHGVPRMDPASALAALRAALERDETHLVVADIRWEVFSWFFTATHPSRLLDDLPDVRALRRGAEAAAAERPAEPESTLPVHRLAGASEAERNRVLLDLVRDQVSLVLGHDSGAAVEPGRAFGDLGLTSAGAVELRNRLTLTTGLRVSATVVFDHPSPTALARFLASEIAGEPAAGGAAGVTGPSTRGTVTAPAAAADDPIVIVGMSCRFPGGVRSPEDLWELVASGTDAMTPFPTDRGWEKGLLARDGADYTREGGFVPDAVTFDADLFAISPREALAMDPQQRLLLEASWEAFERAGIHPRTLTGSRTAVYAGTGGQDYLSLLALSAEAGDGYLVTGGSPSVVSGRVAYTFGLEGPAVTVDTACSSGLVALHLAQQALRFGECDLALVGGVNVLSTPSVFAEFTRARGQSSTGRCRSFAESADGTGWGEGVGVLLVERLSDARRNGHEVLAVVRGSAINQDGASNGLTAPNGPSQQRVIRAALASAGLAPADVDLVEAHGTGTSLGDPIEAEALLATYGQDREEPLRLGSVKSNIGHTQAAAGIAGVIKAVMALRHGTLPPTLHVDAPTSHVDWTAGAVQLVTEGRPWPDTGRPRRAGVSSFGISGTNAHTILEQAPAAPETARTDPPADRPALPLPAVLSAADPQALARQAARLAATDAAPADLALSLAHRADQGVRAVVIGDHRGGHRAGLDALADGAPSADVVADRVVHGGFALLFTGQGAQYPGMGRELYETFPVFADAFDAVCARVDVGRPPADVVFGDGDALNRTLYTQPALFALQVALYRLIESLGTVPGQLVGHSIGELAAAHVAGVLSLDDACVLVSARARLMDALPEGGGMLAVEAAEEEITLPEGVDLAAVNAPRSLTLSGDADALDALEHRLREQGHRCRRLTVSHAFHSHRMEPMLDEFAAVARTLTFHPPAIHVVPTAPGAIDTPEYWVRQVREPVRFADAVRRLTGVRTALELGPSGVLAPFAEQAAADLVAVPALRPGRPEAHTLVAALARLHTRGVAVDWTTYLAPAGGTRVDLPTYPFERRRYWPTPVERPALPAASPAEDRFWAAVDRADTDAVAGALRLDADQRDGLDAVLPALSAWRERGRADARTDPWRYRIGWTPLTGPATRLTGTWLLVTSTPRAGASDTTTSPGAGDPGPRTTALTLADALRRAGAHVIELTDPGTDRAALAARLTSVLRDPADPDRLVAGVLARPDTPAELLTLLQALNDTAATAPLWCATTGAVTVDPDDPSDPAAARLWGIGRVAALEHPGRWGGLVDLPARLDPDAADHLARVLSGTTGEDQTAVRAGGAHGRRLRRAPAPDATTPWRPTGTVLVTGGTGALGGHVARMLADRGAPAVLLASRRGPDAPGAADLAADLADRGCACDIVACDLTDPDAVADLLARHPVTAVFHAAGTVDDGVLDTLTPDRLEAVLAAKADSADHLDRLTGDLTAFVTFSSLAGVLGSTGQGAYAAANAHLDALVERRRAQGLPGTSVAWGAWAGAGMAAEATAAARLARAGLPAMPPDRALEALGAALDADAATLVVADIDWERFAPGFTAVRPTRLLTELPEAAPVVRDADAGAADPRSGLTALPPEERLRTVETLVTDAAAAVLGHAAGAAVDRERAFRDLGFDSLTALELRNLLAARTGLALPAGLVFDFPTPAALAAHLLAELTDGEEDAPTAGTGPGTAHDEPIAIIGMSCRFPGGADSPEALWDLVAAGTDALTGFPADRGWDLDALTGPDGASRSRTGGFLDDIAAFDAGLFRISPNEALAMDPQQRLLLEASWEAFERAGIPPTSVHGTDTGVFAGTNGQDYAALLLGTPAATGGHLGTGNTASVLSGRVSYTFGLRGPALSVDTACSSSLVALHLAVRSLRAGECSMALASGITLMPLPSTFVEFSTQGGLSADGRCKAFSADADGTGWGEGVGVLLVERLSDALAAGHPVLAVVRGTAVNQDGASNGLTAPNGPAQERVIRAALADAGLTPHAIDAVEAHGTGTTLGDPIEAQALLATYGRDRARPLWLGSVKSNIGHTQAAAGVAGIIKMVGALHHGVLPRTLHADVPSPHIDWSSGAVRLLTDQQPWPEGQEPRRAGISSFGVSGTNAHVVLEEYRPDDPATPAPEPAPAPRRTVPWPLSARTAEALPVQAARLLAALGERDAPADVGRSLIRSRAVLEHRAVVLADDLDGFRRGLRALADGAPAPGLVTRTGPTARPGTVFVYPGQGSQWAGMAAGLLGSEPVFAARMAECAAALAPYTDFALLDVVRDGGTGPERVEEVQCALWAVMVSLTELWRSAGVAPAAVAGHSQGEIAAAVVAGALTLEDGARVVALRARLIAEELAGLGGMVSLAVGEADALALLSDRPGLSVAAVNGPRSTVVSGDADSVTRFVAHCAESGVRARRVPVDYASHSAHVEILRERLAADLAPVRPRGSTVPFYSSVTGGPLDTVRLDASYWYDNLRMPVRFEEVTRALLDDGRTTFLEPTAHPGLAVGLRETLDERGTPGTVLHTLRRDEGGRDRWLTALAEAHVHGVAVDWTAVHTEGRPVALPTYAFARDRYWPEPAAAAGTAHREGDPAEQRFWADVERGDTAAVADALRLDEPGLTELLPALAAWRQTRRDASTVDSWRYEVTWTPLATPPAPAPTGRWLLVLPAEAEAEATDAPDAAGATARDMVLAALSAADVTQLVVPADTDRAALAARLASTDDLAGVVSLLALDERPHPAHDAIPLGLAHTLTLLQALGDAGIDAPVRCLTRGAVSVGRSDPGSSPAQAMVWGLGRSAALEHPDRWAGLLDLPGTPDPRATTRLAALLAGAAGPEDQLALRPSGCYARRLRRAAPATAATRPWTPDGPVLVTGGTGALGRRVAHRLARRGVTDLILLSRSGPAAPGADALVTELAAGGARATVVACDVTDRTALADLLARHPVTGVVHTAGTAAGQPLATATPAGLQDAVRAKVLGAVHLDHLLGATAGLFVLFSSIAGTWGSGGQAGYAAANAHLDALAHRRTAEGLAATSVAWGAWGGAGMAAEADAGAFLRDRGIAPMDPERCLDALDTAVDSGRPGTVVADVDWNRFAPAFTARRPSPLLDDLAEAARPPAESAADGSRDGGGDGPERSGPRARLEALPAADRPGVLLDLVRTTVATVLGHSGPDAIDPTTTFTDLGIDSLTALRVRDGLTGATGLALPSTLVFDHPTATAVTAELLTALTTGPLARTETSAAAAPAPAGDDDPVVIVSMSCRYPGGAVSPEHLWDLVADGVDAMTPFPADRGWDLSATGGFTAEGGFVHDATEFDADLFGISPREAVAMDPHQRLLLETAWELLERGGIAPDAVRGSRTGVFVGASAAGYALTGVLPEGSEAHALTGGSNSVISGRVSYAFGLEGPAVTIDTACSSSLVALHLAARSLRAGECELALAGGVTVMPTPAVFAEFGRQGGLAAGGRCRSFAASADGTGWGEGAGLLLLERLSDARRNGHEVLAVVRGSAVNQDGASNGLTAPNGPSQQRVIRAALADAGLGVRDVDAVEGHGTGTRLGDPIEAQALLATYGQDREEPLWLGSLKSNIGHTQAASGVAGVIKMVEAMRRGVLPPTLHVDEPTTEVDWSAGAVRLLTESRPWPATGRPVRAGVSSFGISGTNAHVILEQPSGAHPAPAGPAPEAAAHAAVPAPWLLSGRSAAALRGQAARLRGLLDRTGPGPDARGVAHALATTRATLDHRAVVIAPDADGLRGALDALAEGRTGPHTVRGTAVRGRLAFLFSGQGAQRAGMGRELYDAFPAFAEAFDEVCAHLDPLLDRPLRDVVFHDADALGRTGWAQPALFAHQVALFRLLESWGVVPDRIAGHSVGELAAAHTAGVLSLPDACALVAARGALMDALPPGGAMTAVRMTEAEARAALAGFGGRAELAAVNTREDVVVSGDADALEELAALGRATDRRMRRMDVSHAFHSPHMDPVLDALAAEAAKLAFRPARIPLVSTVTGLADDGAMSTPGYWAGQARATVRFSDAVTALVDDGATRFLELGPGTTLTALVERVLERTRTLGDAEDAFAVATQRPDRDQPTALLTALARLHTTNGTGPGITWGTILAPGRTRPALPTYAFQRTRYWPAPHPAGPGTVLRPAAPEDAYRYTASWRPMPEPERAVPGGDWLLVHTDDDDASTPLAALLQAEGMRLTGVRVSGDDDRHTCAKALLAALPAGRTVAGVLCLATGPATAAALAHALGDTGTDAPLWCLTTGAVTTGPNDPAPDPRAAALWGLGRTVALEAPHRWGGLVDLPAGPDTRTASRLAALLAAGGAGEDQIALRAAPLARRLRRAPLPADAPRWTPSGTVLVTGSHGAARWAATRLAARGADHLVLLARDADTPEVREFAAGLPVAVTLAAADATDRAAVAAVLDAVPADRPLTAVVHTDAARPDGEQRTDGGAAVEGARVLHALTSGLDAFVLFSSVAGVWGEAGATARSAACAGLDALAGHRAALGLPATSLSWGPAAPGDAPDGGAGGLRPLDPEDAWGALETAVAQPDPCVTVADIDPDPFHASRAAAGPDRLFDGIPELRPSPAEPVAPARPGPAALTGPDGDRAVLGLVRTTTATVLGHPDTEPVAPDRGFLELGVDSLGALEVRTALERATGLELPGTVVFDHPTPAALARHLHGLLTAQGRGPDTGAHTPVLGISPTDRNPVGLLNSLYREATRTGRVSAFLDMVGEAARFRPVADTVTEAGGPARPVPLADGPAPELLVCVSGLTAGGGPHEFARLAAPLRGERRVAAVPVLGYGRGELLPATPDVALDWQAEGVLAHADGSPVVLFGHSGGALLAHRLAARLTDLGAPPAALVLADVYPLDDPLLAEWNRELSEGVFDRVEQYVEMDDVRLTAMAWYGRLFWDSPGPDDRVPTLLVRAREPLRAPADGGEWRSSWSAARDVVDVPGNHFTMMAEHAATTARAVHRWIASAP